MTKKHLKKTPKRSRSTVPHEEPTPGTRLTAALKGRTFSATVVVSPDRKPEIEFEGARYRSLSAAGEAAVGYAVNGWRFWKKVEDGDPC